VHAVAAALCRAFGGAIVSTSANPATAEPARDPSTVAGYFGEQVDMIVEGAVDPTARVSSIRDVRTGQQLR
jgi:L-threonylcarbamoyladenylate synthase